MKRLSFAVLLALSAGAVLAQDRWNPPSVGLRKTRLDTRDRPAFLPPTPAPINAPEGTPTPPPDIPPQVIPPAPDAGPPVADIWSLANGTDAGIPYVNASICDDLSSEMTGTKSFCGRGDGTRTGITLTEVGTVTTETWPYCGNGLDCGSVTNQRLNGTNYLRTSTSTTMPSGDYSYGTTFQAIRGTTVMGYHGTTAGSYGAWMNLNGSNQLICHVYNGT
jgi:hypothetical protein